MAVYTFFEVTLRPDATDADRAAYDEYRSAVPAIVERHGGRYLARGWTGRELHDGPVGDRFHLLEFPDDDAVRAFWESPEYRAIAPKRLGAATVRAVVVAPPSA